MAKRRLPSTVSPETAASIRFGRRRLVLAAMGLSIASGLLVGFLRSTGYWIAAALVAFAVLRPAGLTGDKEAAAMR